MGYKQITPATIVNLCVIVVCSLLAGFLFARNNDPWFMLFLLPVPFAGFFMLHRYNRSNQQIAFFFEAIQNEDSSLKFPSNIKQKSLRQLYQSLNNLNERINEIKLKNEYLEKYYQTFIQHAAIGLMAINQNNEVEIMNNKAFDYAGIPPFVPLHLIPVKNPDLFNILVSIKPGEKRTYQRYTRESQINLLIRCIAIHFGDNSSKLLSLQDIRQELDEKELDSWQKLIRVLTHEIMNSIAPIVSLTGTLRKFFIENGEAVNPGIIDGDTIGNVIQGLDTIEERGNGLVNFVNSYRKLTRIPQPEFATFPIQDWLDHTLLLLQEALDRRSIGFQLIIEPKIKVITGDKKLLTQVLINILNNAMEALEEIPSNRKIRISAELTKQEHAQIRISNNGPMIPAEAIDKIFIPFFTTKESGSGIGLSLSHQILRLHHGYIHVESDHNLTSFIITL